MKLSRAQIAIEFVMVVAIALTLVIAFIAINANRIADTARTKELLLLQQETASIGDELMTASIVHDGYNRVFIIGENLQELNFSAAVNNTLLITKTLHYELIQRVPAINGSLRQGNNSIRTEGGIIYLNS